MGERTQITIDLAGSTTEIMQEEIVKEIGCLSGAVRQVRFANDCTLQFDVEAAGAEGVTSEARAIVDRVSRALRGLRRRVAFRSPKMNNPVFAGLGTTSGIDFQAPGLPVLSGLPLALFRYFDRRLEEFGQAWHPSDMRAPVLIAASVLARSDYFASFPQLVTFAAHLPRQASQIAEFRERHRGRTELNEEVLASLAVPEFCLSPAMCYHVYHALRESTLPAATTVVSLVGRCFRHEWSQEPNLTRLRDFTMRELVFLGARERTIAERARGMELFQNFLEELELAGEIRTASDPFFVAPDSTTKVFYQIGWESKFEVSLPLPDGGWLAVGSFNDHRDFFGKAFDISAIDGSQANTACFAWGIERWVQGFLVQHGDQPDRWPESVRMAPEFKRP